MILILKCSPCFLRGNSGALPPDNDLPSSRKVVHASNAAYRRFAGESCPCHVVSWQPSSKQSQELISLDLGAHQGGHANNNTLPGASRNRKSLATFHRTLKSQCKVSEIASDSWGPRWASQSQIAKIAAISVR